MASEASTSRIAGVVALYFVVSICLVFSNKYLLSSGLSIPAPIFISWYQCVLTAAIIGFLGSISKNARPGEFLSEFTAPAFSVDVALRMMPLSVIFVGMISMNNLCLQLIEVSFYNVARSLTIVFNVVFTYFYFGEKTSFRVLTTLGVVIFGFFIGSDGEVNFSLIGTVFGVIGSMFVSLNSIYTKKLLPVVQEDKWRLAFYNNVNASILFIPVSLLAGEISIIREHSALLYSSAFWAMMTVAGVLGLAIGIVTVMQIKVTSPLTHNISGTAKACVQTMLAVWIWGNEQTAKGMLGVLCVIFGSMLYAWVRLKEDEESKARQLLARRQQEQQDEETAKQRG